VLGISIACQNESNLVPIPTVQVHAPIYATKGESVQIKATLKAEAGLEYVVVFKNGVAFDVLNYVGQKSVDYSKSYQVEDMPIGSVVNFTFQVTDQNGKSSAVKLFELKVR
jgi:hypothetical protein